MANILLDYVVSITEIEATPVVDTQFLHKVAIVVNPNVGGTAGDITEIYSASEIADYTDNTDAVGYFAEGMNAVFLIQSDDLDIQSILDANQNEFFTLAFSSDFEDTDIDTETLIFEGVKTYATSDRVKLVEWSVSKTRFGGVYDTTESGKGMCGAWGRFLSAGLWKNQQYIKPSFTDIGAVESLGLAESLFSDKTTFYIEDNEFGIRLSLFTVNQDSVTVPYINKEIYLTSQSLTLQFLSANQPFNIVAQRVLLEDLLNKNLRTYYIETGLLDPDGTNEFKVTNSLELFKVNAALTTTPAQALWRMDLTAQEAIFTT